MSTRKGHHEPLNLHTSSSETNGETHQSLSHFNAQWLRLVRIVGCHPITYTLQPKETKGHGETNYFFKFRFFSFSTLYAIVFTGISVIYFIHWTRQLDDDDGLTGIFKEYYEKIAKPESGVTTLFNQGWNLATNKPAGETQPIDAITNLCLTLNFKFVPLSCIHYLLTSLVSTKFFIQALNGVNNFAIGMRKMFPGVTSASIIRLRRFLKKISIRNGIVLCIVSLLLMPIYVVLYRSTNSIIDLLNSKLFSLSMIMMIATFLALVDDTKVLLILKLVQEYFEQITDGIENYMERKILDKEPPDIRDIRQWRYYIQMARKQSKLAVATIQGSSVSALIGLNISLTTSIYLLYSSIFKDLPLLVSNYAVGGLAYCALQYYRLYIKARVAESITETESKLAATLRQMEVNIDSPNGSGEKYAKPGVDLNHNLSADPTATRLEISFIVDPIMSKPTQCILHNCIGLNVSLLFGSFRHVSTYALALIQLDTVQTTFASS